MRALITGGKGFVGHWLAAHLKDHGDDVAPIDIETDISDGRAVSSRSWPTWSPMPSSIWPP